MKIKHAAIAVSLFLGACTGTVTVPPVSVDMPAGADRIGGKYAVYAQTGGWQLKVDTNGYQCSAWSFDADINQVYQQALIDAFNRSFQNVTFVEQSLDQTTLGDYDAQIVIYQQNAATNFTVVPGFFSATAEGAINLTAILALTDGTGLAYQQNIEAKGRGTGSVFACTDIEDAIAVAAQDVVKSIAKDIILYSKDAVRDHAQRTTQNKPPEPAKPAKKHKK